MGEKNRRFQLQFKNCGKRKRAVGAKPTTWKKEVGRAQGIGVQSRGPVGVDYNVLKQGVCRSVGKIVLRF